MQALDNNQVLAAWERGRGLQEPWRALALLELALPEWDGAALAALPLAERNALLLRLHAETFGEHLLGFAECPLCGEQLELMLNARDLEQQLEASPEEVWLEDGNEVRMRAVTSDDLAALTHVPEEMQMHMLLNRTMTTCGAAGRTAGQNDAPPVAWLERFERLNTSAEIRCTVSCSACSQQPVLDLDVARFLWREVAVAARRTLGEIHLLARAYGWSERAILAMSSARRSAYLEMLSA
jgi:hypothetical protein